MSDQHTAVTADLRAAYDRAVSTRAGQDVDGWKLDLRAGFLRLLHDEGRLSLLEVGAGTGIHGKFFADAGLDVVCTDLSAPMVAHCRSLGLEAHQRDFLHLELGRSFDAAFAMNCLLHVPRADFGAVLLSIRGALAAEGLLYLGQYGGIEHQGPLADDSYEPKRFFSWMTDDELRTRVAEFFDVVSFEAVELDSEDAVHFQSLVLRRAAV